MASQYVIDLGYNDDLTTVIKKVNHNFKAVIGQQTKQAQIDSEDAANIVAQIVGDAVDDLVDQIEHEADLREAADDDLEDAIETLDNSLATVATTGDYNDLINQPVIPPGSMIDTAMSSTSENAVQNKVIYNAMQDKADTSSLATVAFTGDHDDLVDNPEALTNMEIEALLT